MSDLLSSRVRVEVAGGRVPFAECAYADEVIGALCRQARRARGRVVLSAQTNPGGSTAATADAILVLDEYRLLCAGAVATTMREAVDELETRLQRQVIDLGEREHALQQFIRPGGDPTQSSRRRRPEHVGS
jgi:mRNA-degrading endonuclease toxin of MazEF toxin-antitoxin module